MKKILLILPLVFLLASGCNRDTKTVNESKSQVQVETKSTDPIDATVDALGQSVDSEQSLQAESDADVVNSDQATIINASNGVTNESNY
jgi:hypothetical protein